MFTEPKSGLESISSALLKGVLNAPSCSPRASIKLRRHRSGDGRRKKEKLTLKDILALTVAISSRDFYSCSDLLARAALTLTILIVIVPKHLARPVLGQRIRPSLMSPYLMSWRDPGLKPPTLARITAAANATRRSGTAGISAALSHNV